MSETYADEPALTKAIEDAMREANERQNYPPSMIARALLALGYRGPQGASVSEIPHTPWFLRTRPTDDGQAVIENGSQEGSLIAVCEWHIAEFIVKTVNERAR